ncbi:MAG: response regulator [Candidatus Muirbacterium halophilum]|nr:response regulator [Candidatus Muirbacterium halophilum]MCK9477294.1 response regulator [Candidatus Muirbacterium halophilum]
MRILIVDDSRTQRAIIKKIVKMTEIDNIEIYEAGNGIEALDKIKQIKIDLIFTDINMPEMNGEEMIDKLNESEFSNIPIVVLTSKGSDITKNKLEQKGIKAFLVKPFTPEDVNEVLKSFFI